jgi:hypothetical protein
MDWKYACRLSRTTPDSTTPCSVSSFPGGHARAGNLTDRHRSGFAAACPLRPIHVLVNLVNGIEVFACGGQPLNQLVGISP